MSAPLRLRLDSAALVANWRWLARRGGESACGAAIKADGYGLGARAVADRLAAAGCRDFFVSTWDEAVALGDLPAGTALSVLHGVRADDMAVATVSAARPVLNSVAQVQRWRATGRPCDVMVDTGMNRLGLTPDEVAAGVLDGLTIATLMSHLACAEDDHAMNMRQRTTFAALAGTTRAARLSLANSAGICLGADFAFDLTRPGLALYGGIARSESAGHIAQVVHPEAQVIQVRDVGAGQTIGYGATFTAPRDMTVAILNLGYADGYARAFAGSGTAGGGAVLGRISMDLIAVDVTARGAHEGEWVAVDFDLQRAAPATHRSQYELLTGLSHRFDRCWA